MGQHIEPHLGTRRISGASRPTSAGEPLVTRVATAIAGRPGQLARDGLPNSSAGVWGGWCNADLALPLAMSAAPVPRSTFYLVLATTGSIVSLLLLGCLPNEDSLFASSVILFVAGLLVVGAIASLGWRRHVFALSFCSVYLVAYPTSGVLLRLFPETAHPMLDTSAETLAASLLVGATGWLAFIWGYCTARQLGRARSNSPRKSQSNGWRLALPLWIGIIGICFRLLVQLYSFYDSTDNFLRQGVLPSILANVGTICSCALWSSTHRSNRLICVALLTAYSLAGLFSGQRADIFLPWFYLGGMMLLSGGSSPRQVRNGMVFSGVLLVLIVVSYPMLTRFKLLMTKERVGVAGMTRAVEATAALDTVLDPYCAEAGVDDGFGQAALRISTRYSHLQYGGNLVVRGQQALGWLYGASLADAVILFIPRFVWPTKPTIGLGEEAYRLMGYQGAGSATVPVSVEWYLNFGLSGVALGMFLVGRMYAALGRWLSGSNPLTRAFSAFLIYPLMIAGQGVSGLVSVVVLHGLPIYLIQMFSRGAGKPSRTSGHRRAAE